MKKSKDEKTIESAVYPPEPVCNDQSSADELVRCSEATRQNIAETIQQVEARISPSRLFDDAYDYFRDHWGDPKRLKQAIVTNPTPFAAVGIGLVLVGAAIAGYSFYKMRRDNGDSQWYPAEVDLIGVVRPEEEAVLPPHQAAEPVRMRTVEEASTEDINAEDSDESLEPC